MCCHLRIATRLQARFTGGYRSKGRKSIAHTDMSLLTPVAAPPATVNWTANGAVTPVKDQQQCEY